MKNRKSMPNLTRILLEPTKFNYIVNFLFSIFQMYLLLKHLKNKYLISTVTLSK